jgi:signal transduction histidine kinase
MTKSLLSRIMLSCLLITAACSAVLGLVLSASYNSQYRENNLQLLTANARRAADAAAQNYIDNLGVYIDAGLLSNQIRPLAQAIGADIFLVERSGRVALCSEGAVCRHASYLVDPAIMAKALTGVYTERGGFGGMYDSLYMVAGVPVVADGLTLGVMFAAAPDAGPMRFSDEVMRSFITAVILIAAMLVPPVYMAASRINRPVWAMAQAAEAFARGDMAVRMPVADYEETKTIALAFNNMSASLSDMEASRRSMIANISHEFKTPITTIGGFIDGMLDGTVPAERYHHYLEVVSREVKRLSRLIVSMLNLARIENGEMTFVRQPVDINELIRLTLFNFEMRIEEKQLDIRGLDSERLMVEADPDMAHQVVYNLIENAVKFAPKQGYIEISHTLEGGMVAVSIKNSGAGISKEEIPRLFDRFYKSDTSRSMDKSGVGLGLHIVKSTLHIMGGDILVKTVEGEYSDFIFSLPAHRDKPASSIFRKGDKLPGNYIPREVE